MQPASGRRLSGDGALKALPLAGVVRHDAILDFKHVPLSPGDCVASSLSLSGRDTERDAGRISARNPAAYAVVAPVLGPVTPTPDVSASLKAAVPGDDADDDDSDVHTVDNVDALFDEDDDATTEEEGEVESRRDKLLRSCAAITADGQLQLEAQQAVLRNQHLKLYLLAQEHGIDGVFSGLLSSNLLALAMQEGASPQTLRAVLETGATATAYILLRNARGEPVRAVHPLLYAVEKEWKDAASELLRAGADPLAVDEKGLVAYLEAAKNNRHPSIHKMLHKVAVQLHGNDTVKTLVASQRRACSSRTLDTSGSLHTSVPPAPMTSVTTTRRLRLDESLTPAVTPPLARPTAMRRGLLDGVGGGRGR